MRRLQKPPAGMVICGVGQNLKLEHVAELVEDDEISMNDTIGDLAGVSPVRFPSRRDMLALFAADVKAGSAQWQLRALPLAVSRWRGG